jgi:hypothetical protein
MTGEASDQDWDVQRGDRHGRVSLSMALERGVCTIGRGAGLYATDSGHAVCIIMAWLEKWSRKPL